MSSVLSKAITSFEWNWIIFLQIICCIKSLDWMNIEVKGSQVHYVLFWDNYTWNTFEVVSDFLINFFPQNRILASSKFKAFCCYTY